MQKVERVLHKLVKNKPVAKFYYRGSHSHPCQRTLLVIEINNSSVKGYELREGAKVRNLKNAPIKTYLLDKIATTKQLRNRDKYKTDVSTLRRMSLLELMINGV